jgi:hypothetical protein
MKSCQIPGSPQQPMKKQRRSPNLGDHASFSIMSRSSSSRSGPLNPFAGDGAVTPPPHNIKVGAGPTEIVRSLLKDEQDQILASNSNDHWLCSNEQSPAFAVVPMQHHSAGLLDPKDFLAGLGEDMTVQAVNDFPSDSSPISFSPSQYLSPGNPISSSQSAASPCESLTTATTMATSMSRVSSGTLDDMSVTGQLNHINLQGGAAISRQGSIDRSATSNGKRLSLKRPHQDEDLAGLGANLQSMPHNLTIPASARGDFAHQTGMSRSASAMSYNSNTVAARFEHFPNAGANLMERSISEQSYQSASASKATAMARTLSNRSEGSQSSEQVDNPLALADFQVGMERSQSMQSNKSTSSLSRRAQQALNRQNQNAQKAPVLQPKPAMVSHAQLGAAAKAGGKAAIAKNKLPYQRPHRDKVMCHQCAEYPDGFRGEHELRRHIDAKHKGEVKKWICVDAGNRSGINLITPLNKCKACSQNKQYGAYYNAAAHLRRAHFKVKPPRGKQGSVGKNSKTKIEGEKPADEDKGKSKTPNDWPSMTELKNWMCSIQVRIDQPGALDDLLPGSLSFADQDSDPVDAQFFSPTDDSQVFDQGFAEVASGMGSNFAGFSFPPSTVNFQNLDDVSPHSTALDLGAALELTLNPQMPLHGGSMPAAIPVSFNFNSPMTAASQSLPHTQTALAGSTYTSPGSSSATITPGTTLQGPVIIQDSPASRSTLSPEELGDFDFNMVFQ